ncbi:unnamed protein product [Medioppia subpectinata]|uniref:acetate--CoA ligase n=1 Tax=Medioppia subpectinata TaxID=1979941 RepID=A0A7R9Q691_9ACAR|nr:unnamed protein product [Medioppia subpectinata]CAG2113629.1 unnamed protein product [Medioppia subpectinata]
MKTVIMSDNMHTIDDYRRLYDESVTNGTDFWRRMADTFDWHTIAGHSPRFGHNFDTSSAPIDVHFMSGSQTNVCHNLIDRNIALGFGSRIAYHWVGHEFELNMALTYSQLRDQVCRFANVLKGLGLKKGDTIINYTPDLIQTVISMLAAIRLGVVYANTFPGYSAQCLAQRMLDLKCKVLITSDVYYSYKRFNDLKQYSDQAINICRQNNHEIKARIFIKYLSDGNYSPNISDYNSDLDPRLDHWWHDLIEKADTECPPVWVDSEDPLFVIFSSGSTGKQKAIVHSSGGFMVMSALVFKHAFNYTDGDVVYCSGCLGWITGQFSHVFGSLANAATVVLSEGSQTYPTPGRWWRIIDEYKVNIFYVNPTDIRNLRSFGDQYPNDYPMADLKVIGVVGETIDGETWKWLYEVIGRQRCPIVNTYFQSETGCPIIFPIPGVIPIKVGSVSLPFFGVQPVIIDENGHELEGEGNGTLLIKTAFPSIARTLYGDYNLYEKTYFHKYPNYYFTGDGMY